MPRMTKADRANMIREQARDLVDWYNNRDAMYQDMDDMVRGKYELPDTVDQSIKEQLHVVVSQDPHDAVRAGTRVLAGNVPSFKVRPVATDQTNLDNTAMIERWILGNFHLASRRRGVPIIEELSMFSLKYAAAAGRVSHIPTENEARGGAGMPLIDNATRFGDFLIVPYNPRDVYPNLTDFGLSGILHRQTMTLKKAIDQWPK